MGLKGLKQVTRVSEALQGVSGGSMRVPEGLKNVLGDLRSVSRRS